MPFRLTLSLVPSPPPPSPLYPLLSPPSDDYEVDKEVFPRPLMFIFIQRKEKKKRKYMYMRRIRALWKLCKPVGDRINTSFFGYFFLTDIIFMHTLWVFLEFRLCAVCGLASGVVVAFGRFIKQLMIHGKRLFLQLHVFTYIYVRVYIDR